VRTLALLGLVLGLLAVTAIASPWIAMALNGRLFLGIRKSPAWLVGPGWPPLVGGAGGLVALAVSALILLPVLRRRSRLPVPGSVPTLAR